MIKPNCQQKKNVIYFKNNSVRATIGLTLLIWERIVLYTVLPQHWSDFSATLKENKKYNSPCYMDSSLFSMPHLSKVNRVK